MIKKCAIMGKDQKIRHPRRAVMRDPFKAIGPFVAHAGYGKDTCHGRAVPWVRVAKVLQMTLMRVRASQSLPRAMLRRLRIVYKLGSAKLSFCQCI